MLRLGLPVLALLAAAALAGCAAPPSDVACRADGEGNHVTWTAAENATSYNVYRFPGEQNLTIEDVINATPYASTNETTFLDTDVTPGSTYQYYVTSLNEEGESLPSEICFVTAIPEFPTLLVAFVAVAGALVGYATMRRRA